MLLKEAPFLRSWEEEESESERDGGWIFGFGDNGQGYGNQSSTPWLQSHCLEQNPLQGLYFHIYAAHSTTCLCDDLCVCDMLESGF